MVLFFGDFIGHVAFIQRYTAKLFHIQFSQNRLHLHRLFGSDYLDCFPARSLLNRCSQLFFFQMFWPMQAAMATMAIGELVTLALETLVVSWCLKILSVVITVIMYGRMIEIYLYTSLAPIPFATMSNREWGHVGTNYFRGLFALAFQAFLMMVCVAIYAALIGSIRVSSDIHSALFGTMAYTVILCFSLLKTGSLSKQIFGSH